MEWPEFRYKYIAFDKLFMNSWQSLFKLFVIAIGVGYQRIF